MGGLISYFKLLEIFVLKVLFGKDEYNITSKHFNPLRLTVISILVLNLFFTVYLLSKLNNVYHQVEALCPAVFTNKPVKAVKDKIDKVVVVPEKEPKK